MVSKRSEYQNQFRSSVIKKNQLAYLHNLNFRNERRDREHLHTPLCWVEENDDVVVSDSEDIEEKDLGKDESHLMLPASWKIKQNQQDIVYKSLAEIIEDSSRSKNDIKKSVREMDNASVDQCLSFDKLSIDNETSEKENQNNNCKKLSKTAEENLKDPKKDIGDKALSIYDIVDKENKVATQGDSVDKKAENTDSNIPAHISSMIDDEANLRKKTFVKRKTKTPSTKKSKRKSPKKAVPATSATVSAAPPSKLPRRPDRQPMAPRPPFLAYGGGDVEENLATHRTHNVRAPHDVYQAALKAAARREAERKRLQKLKEQARRQQQALIDQLSSPRPAMDWRSEYRKQFPAYDAQAYERAVSARAVLPRAAPITALHRGGCLMVVVD